MFEKLDRTDKKIITVGLWTTAILTATVLINTPTIDMFLAERSTSKSLVTTSSESEQHNTPEIFEASTPEAIASVSISDNADGTADIYIDLSEPSQLTGAELYFGIEGDILGISIDCSDKFDCVGSDISDESISIYAFRPLDQVEDELSGSVKVATLTYDPLSAATLTTNDVRFGELLITALGTQENLADPTVRSYTIGD